MQVEGAKTIRKDYTEEVQFTVLETIIENLALEINRYEIQKEILSKTLNKLRGSEPRDEMITKEKSVEKYSGILSDIQSLIKRFEYINDQNISNIDSLNKLI